MSNPHTQSLLSKDEQHVRESLARLLTKAGGDVCFHEIERISGESEHDCSAHRISCAGVCAIGCVQDQLVNGECKPIRAQRDHVRAVHPAVSS